MERLMLGLILLLFLLQSSQLFAGDGEILLPKGTMQKKLEEQVFKPNCKAIRTYPIIEGLENKKVQEKLNAEFKKLLTVGKKLRESDCPIADDSEDYSYINYYVTGAQRGHFLGMRFVYNFPGGSGRSTVDCRIYDLENGQEVKLKKNFKQDKLFELLEFAKKNKTPFSPSEPEGLLQENKNDKTNRFSPFCLEKEGLMVLRSIDGKVYQFKPHVLLTKDMIAKVFSSSPLVEELKK